MIEDGWYLVTTKAVTDNTGDPPNREITIAGHLRHDLAPGTLNSILKQAQSEKERK